MTHFRALVTGSRSWKDTHAVHTALDAMAHAAAQSGYDGLTVVHGGARGADTSAALWVAEGRRRGWPVVAEPHPVSGADWRRHGPGAGMRRNREMVRLGADACLAFVNPCETERCLRARPHGTHGATDCADLAEASDIHTIRITPRPSPPDGAR